MKRLEDGDRIISALPKSDPRRQRYIDGWIELLRQYERACRESKGERIR